MAMITKALAEGLLRDPAFQRQMLEGARQLLQVNRIDLTERRLPTTFTLPNSCRTHDDISHNPERIDATRQIVTTSYRWGFRDFA